MQKRKVLFITPSLCQGGIEHSQIIMLQMLDKSKYDLTLFLYEKDTTLLPLVPKDVRVVIDKEKPHYFRKPKAIVLSAMIRLMRMIGNTVSEDRWKQRLKTYIHAQKAKHPAKDLFPHETFDVVVSNAIGICTEMALYFQAQKYIAWYRASVDMHHEMLTKVFPEYDHIIAVSKGVQELLAREYPMVKEKITIINDYVSLDDVIQKANLPCKIQVPKGYLTISSCGRLSIEKGFDMAVEAAVLLKEKGLHFIWYFIGDGADRPKLEKQISENRLEENIIITGFQENPFSIMKQCDIYVQPSYEESFGRTIKEALILGKPVISTNTAGGREVLMDGKYGMLTPIDAKGLADGITSVLEHQYLSYTLKDNKQEKEEFLKDLEYYLS